jgi:hypothetical protein
VTGLRPFWRYYGGKWRSAPKYPPPRHATIIEPFAGAAGYSLRYPDREVILVEKYHVIAEIWRWLIGVSVDEVLAIPEVDAVADLPAWVPQPARMLVGMCLGAIATRPKPVLARVIAERTTAGSAEGWSAVMRDRVAAQVGAVRHWRVIEDDYDAAPDVDATWFIDHPYRGKPGRRYVCTSSKLDYPALGSWCRSRRGQVIACEAEGADWLPFVPFGQTTGVGGRLSREAVWLS